MKILFTRFPLESIPHGGAERQVMSLATGLRDRKHAVAFVGSCPVLLEEFGNANLIAAELDIGPPPVSKTAIARFALKKKKMRAQLSEMLDAFGKLDTIIMLSLTEKLLLTDIASEKGIKVLWIEHDPVGRWLTKNPWLKLLKKQSALATTVTVSELSRIQYLGLDWDLTKIVVIPNGIDDAWFDEQPNTKKAEATLHLGYVGRLAEEKGVDLLLRAVADMPHTTLDIVGDGPEEAALRKRTERQEHAHRVRFHGRRDDIADFYRQIDALVLPSREIDPFGMVVAEAMAMGVPCIVTDVCGIARLLKDGHDAIVVRSDSVKALAEGIERLRPEKDRRGIATAAEKTANSIFRTKRMIDEYEKVIVG